MLRVAENSTHTPDNGFCAPSSRLPSLWHTHSLPGSVKCAEAASHRHLQTTGSRPRMGERGRCPRHQPSVTVLFRVIWLWTGLSTALSEEWALLITDVWLKRMLCCCEFNTWLTSLGAGAFSLPWEKGAAGSHRHSLTPLLGCLGLGKVKNGFHHWAQ